MSAICQNFVQNAWKKDLCSNCFKSKDEHAQSKPRSTPINSNKVVGGIIRINGKTKPKRSVGFTKELSEVIGYGGEDCWNSDCEDVETDGEEDSADYEAELADGEEEKELQKLTKANTDFNANLLQEVWTETKKSYTQLMLGKPQLDSEGKKQTLLVSVTPFGQEPTTTRKYSKTVSHIPIAAKNNHKETLVESKNGNVILTLSTKGGDREEKSLLDEISETLENSKNPIQIISRKKTEKEMILAKPEVISFNNKENIDAKNKIEEAAIKSEKLEDANKALCKSNIPERKNGLTRTAAIKKDQEKPVIYQTSIAKIELMNTKNLKLSNNSKENVNKTPEKLPVGEDLTKKLQIAEPPPSSEESDNKDGGNSSDESLSSVVSSSSDEPPKSIEIVKSSVSVTPTSSKVAPLPPPPKADMVPQTTREQAGEPDGRADPEDAEPPALPLTPPPTLGTSSFLHNKIANDKPKVPSKPATIAVRRSPTYFRETPQVVLTSFVAEAKHNETIKLEKRDSNGSDMYKSAAGKRKAPQPPTEDSEPIYSRHLEAPPKRDTELSKERASSCLSPNLAENLNGITPEPAPRRSLSLSTDSLSSGAIDERKHKEKKGGRFSLKKFLRMGGSSKELVKVTNEPPKIEEVEPLPQPKPRLVIVHPSELNGAKVQVVSKSAAETAVVDYCNVIKQHSNGVDETSVNNRANRPPPPPRNYEELHYAKPVVPHPPKSQEILNKQKEYTQKKKKNNSGNRQATETVYANIGEVRSAMVPNKPHRTASMREREAQQQKRTHNYEPINNFNENVYDYVSSSSSPECDSSRGSQGSPPNCKDVVGATKGLSQRSESNVDVSGDDYFKYHHQNIPRSMSLTYCGSETESEIYSPYSFYGSESEVTEDDHEWVTTQGGRTHKLRSRKGRSIVHKNLEDNYGAVVVANHEALAQVLDNIQQNSSTAAAVQSAAFRGLKTASNLRWSDFTIKANPPVIIGPRAFHQAVWGTHHVTLAVSSGTAPSSTLSLAMFNLVAVTEFSDLIPIKFTSVKQVAAAAEDDVQQIQATIAVLPWMHVHTIQSYGEALRAKLISQQNNQLQEEAWKDTSFCLLQLVNALKTLQAQGIEELPLSLSSFVLCREIDKDTHYRLYVLQGLGEDLARKSSSSSNGTDPFGTLCTCATSALRKLQATAAAKLSTLLQSLLGNERAVSLTQVKSVLEFSLWGPSDVALGTTVRDRELALQRWLDLQRATVLHGLVCAKVHLTVYEECHLLFLVRSNARMMCDASMLLESSNKQNYINVTK